MTRPKNKSKAHSDQAPKARSTHRRRLRSPVELTICQAAKLLNVSRPYLIKLVVDGSLPCHKTGTHRRIFTKDVLRYKRSIDAKSMRALNELAKEAQKLGLGYND